MSLSTSIHPSRGFHFEYTTRVASKDIKSPECENYLFYQFPSDVFVDRYELEERRLSFKLHGDADLEKPVVAMSSDGLTLEVRLSPPSEIITLPIHARYPLPGNTSYATVLIPQPRLYYACPSTSGTKQNPFAELTTPYSPWWDLSSWEIGFSNPDAPNKVHEIQVPAGLESHLAFVELSTISVVFLACFCLLRVLWRKTRRPPSKTD